MCVYISGDMHVRHQIATPQQLCTMSHNLKRISVMLGWLRPAYRVLMWQTSIFVRSVKNTNVAGGTKLPDRMKIWLHTLRERRQMKVGFKLWWCYLRSFLHLQTLNQSVPTTLKLTLLLIIIIITITARPGLRWLRVNEDFGYTG